MKNCLTNLAAAIALACACTPAAAQDEEIAYESDAFAQGFNIEPLTEEQAARLPTARRVLERVVPEGSVGDMMGGMFGSMDTIGQGDPVSAVSEALGYAYYNTELEESKATRALEIIDPAWSQRNEVSAAFAEDMMAQMFAPLEPIMREAMAELYAIHFTEAQLLDIEGFYATETGQVFARESFAMSSDPRMYAALMGNLDMFENMEEPDMSAMEAALAELPQRRSFDDLSEREREQVAALLGIEVEELRGMMSEEPVYTLPSEEAVDAEAPMDAPE